MTTVGLFRSICTHWHIFFSAFHFPPSHLISQYLQHSQTSFLLVCLTLLRWYYILSNCSHKILNFFLELYCHDIQFLLNSDIYNLRISKPFSDYVSLRVWSSQMARDRGWGVQIPPRWKRLKGRKMSKKGKRRIELIAEEASQSQK